MTTTFPAFLDIGVQNVASPCTIGVQPDGDEKQHMRPRQVQIRMYPSWDQPVFLCSFWSSLDSRFVLAHRWFHCEFIEQPDTNEIFLNLSKSWNWSESSGESFYEKPAFFFFLSLIGNISHVTLITPLGEQKTKTLPAKLIPFWDLDLSDMCICKLHHSSIPDQKH